MPSTPYNRVPSKAVNPSAPNTPTNQSVRSLPFTLSMPSPSNAITNGNLPGVGTESQTGQGNHSRTPSLFGLRHHPTFYYSAVTEIKDTLYGSKSGVEAITDAINRCYEVDAGEFSGLARSISAHTMVNSL